MTFVLASALIGTSDAFALVTAEELVLQDVPIVFTASKRSEKATEAPATVYVVSKKEIDQRGYSNLKDVLRDLPGMETSEFYWSELGTLVPVRGVMGNNKIIVLINGVRVNPPGGEEMMFRSDFSVRGAEQIEVIYGPGSTLYGQDAISATINIITKKPGEGKTLDLLASGGSRSFAEGYAGLSRKFNRVGISFYFQAQDMKPMDFRKDYADWYKQNFSEPLVSRGLSDEPIRWDKGNNAFLRIETNENSLQLWRRESSRSSSEGRPILNYVEQARWHDTSIVIEAKNRFAFTEKYNLESAMEYNKYEIEPDSRYVFPTSTSPAVPLAYWDFKYGVGTGLSLEEKLSADVLDNFSFIAGVKVSNFDIVPKATILDGALRSKDLTDQGGKVSYYLRPGDASSKVEVSRVNNVIYQTYAAYLESKWQVIEPLRLIAGARVDSNNRYSDSPISPRVSAIYDINSNLTAKYIFTQAFVAPPPYFGYNVFSWTKAVNVINADLKPEKATSHEINLNYTSRKTSVDLSAYLNRQDNLLLAGDLLYPANIIQNEIYLDASGTDKRMLTHSANGGKSTAMGFDIFGRQRVGNFAFWNSYSYFDFELDVGGVKSGLTQISRHNIRFGFSWDILHNLSLTPSLVWRSTPENITVPAGLNGITDNPYELNLHAIYSPVANLEIFGNFRNITNNRYALRGMIEPYPQETFRFSMGLRYSM